MKKVLVTDLGGVLYSFDPTFDPENHSARFDEAVLRVSSTCPQFKTVSGDISRGIVSSKTLEAEHVALVNGLLTVFPIKDAAENLVKNQSAYDLAVVANSTVESIKFILEKVDRRIKVKYPFDVTRYGSKREMEAWKKIFQELPSVDVVVEDGPQNLEAAKAAATELGFSPQTYTSMPLL